MPQRRKGYGGFSSVFKPTEAEPHLSASGESVVASLAAGTTVFSTNQGLVAPGATALFKVYVVLTTANEKGSNTVSVTGPG